MVQELDSREAPTPGSMTYASPSATAAQRRATSNAVRWEEPAELPMLRLRVADSARIPYATMIVAVFDHDHIGADDLLGVALVPLTPPGYVAGGAIPQEYEIEIDEPLTFGNVTKDVGNLSGRLTVSFGDKLDAALKAAEAEGLGASCRTLSEKVKLCGCGCLPG